MTDYTELVKALRCCAENFGCPIECPRYSPADEGVRACVSRLEKDAAAAIEALQAENADIREELFISQRKYDEFTTIASMQNAMLAKQLPKRGEIVRCRECRYRITAHGISDGWVFCSKPYTEKGNAMHRADWFCADGEREVQE